jgi:hypothetical protein
LISRGAGGAVALKEARKMLLDKMVTIPELEMLDEKQFDIQEGQRVPKEDATASFRRLTVFSLVPLSLGCCYYFYRATGIAIAAASTTWAQLSVLVAYLFVELSMTGE